MQYKLLAVDDEPMNLMFIQCCFDESGIEILTAEDGLQAWDILQKQHQELGTLLIDRMMPHMDGIELAAHVKSDASMASIPLIMQTAAAQKDSLDEIFEAGFYYCLTKPYRPVDLIAMVKTCMDRYQQQQDLLLSVDAQSGETVREFAKTYTFRLPSEINSIAAEMAQLAPQPRRAALGLRELMHNSIEYGILGIEGAERARLDQLDNGLEEIESRLSRSEYSNKAVEIRCEEHDDGVVYFLKDDGPGFDWKKYLDFDKDSLGHVHGRGIAFAKNLYFSEVNYVDNGSAVRCVCRA